MNIIRKLFHHHHYVRSYYFGHVPITACTSCGDMLHYGRILKDDIRRNQRVKFKH